MKFNFLIASIFLTLSSTVSANWVPLAETENLNILINLKSVSRVQVDNYKNYKKIWTKQVVIKSDPVLSVGDFSLNLYWVDCSNDAYIRRALKIYNKDGSLDRTIDYPEYKVEYFSPDSIMNMIAKVGCNTK